MAAGSQNGVMTQAAVPPPLFSAAFQRNPYPTYRRCLEGPALQPMAGRDGVWLLFGYEACTKLLRDARLSSVRPGSAMVVVPPEELGEFDDLVRHIQRWLLLRDAPRHTELRRLMNRGFTPAVIERARPAIEAILEHLLDAAPGPESATASGSKSGALDLIRDVAYPFSVRVICELLGLPRETHERCVTLSDDIAGWFGDLRRPPDLARVAQCVMLLFGGHETTRNLIGNGLYSLLAHPEVCEQLRGDETLLPAAVEELLRYESPVQAFGGDAHVCLGSTLARLEGRLAIGGVLRRFRNLRLVDESPDWGPNFAFRGLKSLRVDT